MVRSCSASIARRADCIWWRWVSSSSFAARSVSSLF